MRHDDTSFDGLDQQLRSDGLRLREGLAPRGALAALVGAELDLMAERQRCETFAAVRRLPRRGGGLRQAGALLAAAVLLLLLLPLGPHSVRPVPEAAPSTSFPMLAASDIQALHPIHILRALPEPLSALVEGEASDLQIDARRAADGLVERLPAFLGLRLQQD